MSDFPELLTRKALAERFGVYVGQVSRWEKDGCPVARKQRRGKPSMFDVAAVEAWLSTREKQAQEAEPVSLQVERARLARLQADGVELRNKLRRGEVLERADVVLAGQMYTKAWQSKVRTLPRRLVRAGVISAEQEPALVAACHDLLTEIATWNIAGAADEEEPAPSRRRRRGRAPETTPPAAATEADDRDQGALFVEGQA